MTTELSPKWDRLLSLLLVLVGNVIYALSIKLFVLPANLMSCGTTGIALVVTHFFPGLSMSVFILIFNVVMLALGWWLLGRRFAMTTILSSLFYPIALELLNRLLGDVRITDQMLLNVLFAGMGMGLSLGLVLRGGASTGGMDIPPLIIQKYFRIPLPVTLWTFDFCILLSQMSFHPWEDLLYGVLFLIVISLMLNKVLVLGTERIEVKIVSKKHAQIVSAILSQVDRGATLLYGKGGYSGDDTEVILSVVAQAELPKIERVAREIDPNCFMIVSHAKEVWGRGFSYGKRTPVREEE